MNFKSIEAKLKKCFSPENEDIYSSRNLKPLERGLLQKIFVFIVYTVSITVLALGLEWFAYPLVNRLITHALPGEKYTRTQIQDEFMRELSGYPELEDPIRQLLHTQKKEADNTPFDLEGWAMEEIRNALGEYVQTDPGRKK